MYQKMFILSHKLTLRFFKVSVKVHVKHTYDTSKTLLMCVVYFNQLLGVARTQKLVETFFSAVFQKLMFISNLLQWFYAWNQQKTSEKEQKHVFVYSSKQVDMQKLVDSLRGYLKIVFFRFVDFRCERLKNGWKNVFTSFSVHAAPKSWLKYTTDVYTNYTRDCKAHCKTKVTWMGFEHTKCGLMWVNIIDI